MDGFRPGDQVKTPDGRFGRVIKVDRGTGTVWVRCSQRSNVNRCEIWKLDALVAIK